MNFRTAYSAPPRLSTLTKGAAIAVDDPAAPTMTPEQALAAMMADAQRSNKLVTGRKKPGLPQSPKSPSAEQTDREAKKLRILRALSDTGKPMSVTEIARVVDGISSRTAPRLVEALYGDRLITLRIAAPHSIKVYSLSDAGRDFLSDAEPPKETPSAAKERRVGPRTLHLTLRYIAECGQTTTPDISENGGVGYSVVKRAVRQLAASGLITIEKRASRYGGNLLTITEKGAKEASQ